MKGLFLAGVFSGCIFAAMTLVFILRPNLAHVGASLTIFAFALLLLLIVYFVTSDNLGFLPNISSANNIWLDMLVAVFALAASFFGGWLQLYNLASRGYSLRILVDLLHAPHGLQAEHVVDNYAEGRGLSWMYGLRLAGLIRANLITMKDGYVLLTGRGHKTTWVFRILRTVYVGRD